VGFLPPQPIFNDSQELDPLPLDKSLFAIHETGHHPVKLFLGTGLTWSQLQSIRPRVNDGVMFLPG
jgi:hypothetical protein